MKVKPDANKYHLIVHCGGVHIECPNDDLEDITYVIGLLEHVKTYLQAKEEG